MTWFIAGMLAPLFWALTNIVDQISIRKYFVADPLLITTAGCFLSILGVIGLTIYDPNIWNTDLKVGLIFTATAFFNCFAFLGFYKALEKDEASNVVPLFQILPIFIFLLAFVFLGETISNIQIIGASSIILGAFFLMIDFKNKTYNWRTLYLMMFCCTMLAVTTIFDRYALDFINWYTAMAWKGVGYVVFAIFVFLLVPKTRKQCITLFKNPFNIGISFLLLTEILALLANGAFILSLDQSPSAGISQTLNGFQPLYVLILGYIAFKLFPDVFQKPKEGRYLGFHLACLSLMIFGLYLIY